MGFCTKCGKEISEESFFCLNCGVRTVKGKEADVAPPVEDWREAFSRVGHELEKAAKEMEKAFEEARQKIRESVGTRMVVCPHCGGTNPFDSSFCYKCGRNLTKQNPDK
jgi:adenine-specific DNA methylase